MEVADSSLRVAIGGMPLLHHGHPSALEDSAASYCTEYLLAQIGRWGSNLAGAVAGPGAGVSCHMHRILWALWCSDGMAVCAEHPAGHSAAVMLWLANALSSHCVLLTSLLNG